MALLDDRAYQAELRKQVAYIISNSSGGRGWLGPLDEQSKPAGGVRGSSDFWLQYRMLNALTQYAEVELASDDVKLAGYTVKTMLRFTEALDALLSSSPIFVGDWSHSRMVELMRYNKDPYCSC